MTKTYDRKATDLPANAIVAPVEVDDPLEKGARLLVMMSVRDDPLAVLKNANEIDNAQYLGGRDWQRLYEAAEVGGARAIDPTKEAVDGGRIQEFYSTSRYDASMELKRIWKMLGQDRSALIHDLLVSNLSVGAIAMRRGMLGQRAYFLGQIVVSLEKLAKHFRYA